MLNLTLRNHLSDGLPEAPVFLINPGIDETDHEEWVIGKVTFLSGIDPEDTIIEAGEGGEGPTIRTGELLSALAGFAPDGTVQVYIKNWEMQSFAYFDIGHLRYAPGRTDIILGEWRCGG